MANDFNLKLPIQQWLDQDDTLDEEKLRERIQSAYKENFKAKEEQVSTDIMRQFEKAIMLQTLDTSWREHLAAMDYLRQGIHLRGYAQKNPKQEYKRESFEMFAQLLDRINYEVISGISKFEVRAEQDIARMEADRRSAFNQQQITYTHAAINVMPEENEVTVSEEKPRLALVNQPFERNGPKVGRNDPCPCGSGKKYKQCHGRLN